MCQAKGIRMHENNSKLLICMGVSGCGKSSVARRLSEYFTWRFIDADDHHSDANKQHMESGKPLSDSMRKPWLLSVISELNVAACVNENCVLAFSGLKAQHRQMIREMAYAKCRFLHLKVSPQSLRKRLLARQNHFMPASLLDSQLEALQLSECEMNINEIDANQCLDKVIVSAVDILTADDYEWT